MKDYGRLTRKLLNVHSYSLLMATTLTTLAAFLNMPKRTTLLSEAVCGVIIDIEYSVPKGGFHLIESSGVFLTAGTQMFVGLNKIREMLGKC